MVKTASNPVVLMLKGNYKIRHLISVQRLKASSSKAVQNCEKAREGDIYTHNWQAAMGWTARDMSDIHRPKSTKPVVDLGTLVGYTVITLLMEWLQCRNSARHMYRHPESINKFTRACVREQLLKSHQTYRTVEDDMLCAIPDLEACSWWGIKWRRSRFL